MNSKKRLKTQIFISKVLLRYVGEVNKAAETVLRAAIFRDDNTDWDMVADVIKQEYPEVNFEEIHKLY